MQVTSQSWRRIPRRSGFTLLEVLLASTIGVLLLSALYVAVNVQLHHAQAGRDLVQRGTLARGLLARIARDISPTLAPALPTSGSQSSSGSSGSSASSSMGGSSSTAGSSSTT